MCTQTYFLFDFNFQDAELTMKKSAPVWFCPKEKKFMTPDKDNEEIYSTSEIKDWKTGLMIAEFDGEQKPTAMTNVDFQGHKCKMQKKRACKRPASKIAKQPNIDESDKEDKDDDEDDDNESNQSVATKKKSKNQVKKKPSSAVMKSPKGKHASLSLQWKRAGSNAYHDAYKTHIAAITKKK